MDNTIQQWAVLETVRRKLRKSFQQRGILGTARRAVTRPLLHVYYALREWTPSRLARRKAERQFDEQFNVNTRQDRDLGWMSYIETDNWQYGSGYEPAPIKSLTTTLESLPINFEESVFIDFGSGKARSLFIAAQFPFKQAIGVEYSSQLHEFAEQNMRTYRNDARKCHDLQCVCQDAATFPIPSAPLLLFFNHPFDEPVFTPLIERIEASLREQPRECFVVYYDPQCAALFEQSPLFQRFASTGDFDSKDKEEFVVWQADCQQASMA